MLVDIQSEISEMQSRNLLKQLLTDRTTKQQIMETCKTINIRALKAIEQQAERTKQYAEVFTPLRICKTMNDYAEQHLKNYMDSRCMEITCGEAPFLVSRYDMETAEMIPIPERTGLLDRKLKIISASVTDETEWMRRTMQAFQSIYGFEFQPDNVLIARLNLLMTFKEYLQNRWNREPTEAEYRKIINIITWNVFQMDGLTGTIPDIETMQLSLFKPEPKFSQIKDWSDGGKVIQYPDMKFDFIIGNPPYQDVKHGNNKGYAPPIYHQFLENSYQIASAVELIHPARFLFNAGSTPKKWNQKMLQDTHLKVLHYEQEAGKIFKNTEIKGGIAITFHDTGATFEPIKVFSPYPELNEIMRRTGKSESLTSMIFNQNKFNLSALYAEYPEYQSIIGSNGKDSRFRNNIFEKVSLFTENQNHSDDIAVIGVLRNKRQWRYLPERFVDTSHENLFKWKVLVTRVNGTGALGEVLSTPIIAKPREGYTQTFIGVGAFDTQAEAENALKYLKTKFVRIMLGILKITQDNSRDTWKMVPAQDFKNRQIDWSKSIPEIDQQLYEKYKFTKQEIEFFENHAK